MRNPLAPVGRSLSLLLLAAAVGMGCASDPLEVASRPAPAEKAATPEATTAAVAVVATRGKDVPDGVEIVEGQGTTIKSILELLGDDGKQFHAHVTTLSDPFFEGRVPGSRGNELAADYIEHYYRFFGLEPAFPASASAAGGAEVVDAKGSYRQPFTVPGDPKINKADVSYALKTSGKATALKVEKDFNPLAISANGEATGELAFVGYAIEQGEKGYSSFSPHDDLKGKIALALRFEPMDEHGHSLWSEDDGWTRHAGLLAKVKAAAARGAAGVILVNTPGADDKRVTRIMSIENSRIGGKVDVPVIMMTAEAANAMVKHADPQGRSLLDLRELADKGDVTVVEMPDATVSMAIDTERESIRTANVGAVLPGKGALANEYVVIGAHYDHIGYGKFGSRTPDHMGEVHPGADDNGSGTAAILVLARKLSEGYAAMPAGTNARSILFLSFSAEEMGLLGSKAYIENPSVPPSQMMCMINMDMVGRLRKEGLEVSGVGTGEELRELVAPIVDESGIHAALRKSGQMPSDQATFVEASVPVLGFFTGTHPEYHTVYDVGSTINDEGATAIIRLINDVALALATRTPKLAYHAVEQVGPKMGSLKQAKVRLGIAPGNYNDDDPGVLVGSVSADTTAEKAGIQKGDRIIRWGGEELANVVAMMERLSAHSPGDKVDIVVLRDGKEVTLHLVMQGRDEAR